MNTFPQLRPALAMIAALLAGCGDPNAPRQVASTLDDRATIASIWGSSASDVWAVGFARVTNATCDDGSVRNGQGYLRHWDGEQWSTPTIVADMEFVDGVSGSGPNDVWIVGSACARTASQRVMHWNGSTWTTAFMDAHAGSGWLAGVWASGPADAWAVGGWVPAGADTGPVTLLRWDGTAWTEVADPSFTAVPANDPSARRGTVYPQSPNSVFFVMGSRAYHFDGVRWAEVSTFGGVYSVVGAGPDDVLIATHSGVYRWNGTDFRTALGDAYPTTGSIWAGGADDVWSMETYTSPDCGTFTPCHEITTYQRHWDGTQWSRVESDAGDNGIWGVPGGPVWFASSYGIYQLH